MTTISGVTAVATSASSPVDDEHDHGRADDREHVLEEEDEAVAEEEADGLEVDRRAREELAGLVAVVEAEREAEELRVERVAHVELDAERLPARDQAPARHEDRARRADAEHERGDDVELVAALGVDRLLEPGSGEVRDRDRRGLGADREHDRDDQRPLVRLQEAEQADERLAIGTVVLPQSKSSLRYLRSPSLRRETRAMGTEFPREEAFDEDYLYFYEELLTPERTAGEVEAVWKLLELEPGLELLDLACGHGRIANALAERGVRVTGLDATPLFLDLARKDAAERGVEVEYVEGDMRSIPWRDRFDRVLCWFTSFGYFSDEENRDVLAGVYAALRPGGLFAVEMNHRDNLLGRYLQRVVSEKGEDRMIDTHRFDVRTSRSHDERTIVRGGRERSFAFEVRMFTAAELRDWLLAAGFSEAEPYGEDGEPLTLDHRRMTLVARK